MEETKKKETGAKILRYPLKNIDKSDDFLKIQCFEYIPPGLNTDFKNNFSQKSSDDANYGEKEHKGTIILPIPQSILDSNNVDWGAQTMNPIDVAVSGVTGGLLQSGDKKKIEDLFGNLVANSGSTLNSSLTQKALTAYLGNQASSIIPGSNVSTAQIFSRLSGAVINSNVELLFNSVMMRQGFSFSFDFVPRSEKESDQVKEIIRFFKTNMSAKKGLVKGAGAGLFIKSPNVFKVEYMSGNKEHPFLNKIKMSALTAMSIDYTGSGTYATYPDATPVHMKMTLSFSELTPIFYEDYYKEDLKEGKQVFKFRGTGY